MAFITLFINLLYVHLYYKYLTYEFFYSSDCEAILYLILNNVHGLVGEETITAEQPM